MNIKINLFRQASQSVSTPRGNVMTTSHIAAGRERSWQSKFDGLLSRNKKTISTQPPAEKRTSTDSKTSRTAQNVVKRLKQFFRPCGSTESKLLSESELIKQFPQVPPRLVPANHHVGAGTKASTPPGTTKSAPPRIKPPKRTDSLAHLNGHKAGSAPRSRGTSSKEALAKVKIGQVNVKKVKFEKVEVEIKTMKTELSTKTLISEEEKTAKKSGRWLPVEPGDLTPPIGLSKSNKGPVME
ncbi:hypothetical protein [Mycetohabitans sp. B46]|uniref:hypothetical protein n=1 Tax=Mycetohabitans sp. B46 TaxID=2772536 RepID=UPI00307E6408